jgi:excinuclease UvrABC ATPase subunit
MHNVPDGRVSAPSEGRDDIINSIAFDLNTLIAHVQASMEAIEAVIAQEAFSHDANVADNVIVLDDVTPRYLSANAALSVCNAKLGVALQFVLDAAVPKQQEGELVDAERRGLRMAHA